MAPAATGLIQAMLTAKELDDSVRQALARQAESAVLTPAELGQGSGSHVDALATQDEQESGTETGNETGAQAAARHSPAEDAGCEHIGAAREPSTQSFVSTGERARETYSERNSDRTDAHSQAYADSNPADSQVNAQCGAQEKAGCARVASSSADKTAAGVSRKTDTGSSREEAALDTARLEQLCLALDAAAGLHAAALLLVAELCRPGNEQDLLRYTAGAEILCRIDCADKALRARVENL